MYRSHCTSVVIVTLMCGFLNRPATVSGQVVDSNQATENRRAIAMPNLQIPTLGGKQFWTDHRWRQGWKIQRNALTKHWRLIDDKRIRHAWGTREACQKVLDAKVPSNRLPSTKVIFLLHGLMRSSDSMKPLGRKLQESIDCTIATFEYASTRASISEHAAAFEEVVMGLPENSELTFIGHSMGNIVVRHAIGNWMRANNQAQLDRIEQVIMLGPPNQGASIARQLSKVGLFEWVAGEGGLELGPKWEQFESKLAIPHCAFGIIAGRLSDKTPQNPLVGGQSDFVVSVEETRLAGATDTLEVPRLHSFLMDDAVVQQAVVNFVLHQQFRSAVQN